MLYSLRQIEVFIKTTQTLNISRTASLLNMTVPAAWKQINNLENLCGKKLFNRNGKRLSLTSEGFSLIQNANKLINISGSLAENIRLIQQEKQATIKISVGSTLQSFIFNLLNPFIHEHKNMVQFKFEIDSQTHSLQKERHDFYFMFDNTKISHQSYETYPLIMSDFVLVCSNMNKLAYKKEILNNDLQNIQLLHSTRTHEIEESYTVIRLINHYFDKLKADWNNKTSVIYFETYLSLREAVKANLGIGFLPRILVDDGIKILSFHDKNIENMQLKVVGAIKKEDNPSYTHLLLKEYIIQFHKNHSW